MSGHTILFLDDDMTRTRAFISRLQPHARLIVTVETAGECIAQLDASAWDLVLLDHDLGGEVFVDSAQAETGAEVVRWLKGNRRDHGAFIVHSMNPVGAASMYFDLKEMGYRVSQAAFGSAEFWEMIADELGLQSVARGGRSTLSDRLARYIRSIRTRKL